MYINWKLKTVLLWCLFYQYTVFIRGCDITTQNIHWYFGLWYHNPKYTVIFVRKINVVTIATNIRNSYKHVSHINRHFWIHSWLANKHTWSLLWLVVIIECCMLTDKLPVVTCIRLVFQSSCEKKSFLNYNLCSHNCSVLVMSLYLSFVLYTGGRYTT